MPGLLDQVDPYAGGYSLMEDPFEAAARRQRQAVMPIGGRQEGWLTENPDFGMVVPRSPADVALLAAGGPLGRAAKVAALAGAGVLSSDEAQAGKVSALKDIISRAGGAVKGGAFSKKSGEVLDEIAAGPKGAGPMDLSTSAQIPDVPQVPMERWQPPRGVSQRMQDALANREVSTGILGTIDRGIGLGADKWYHTEPVRQAWINELGPVAGPREFARYMDMVAATSPRSDVPTNIRNASYYYQHAAAGKELPDTLPYPYGHVAQNLHRDRKSTRLNSSHTDISRMPSSA